MSALGIVMLVLAIIASVVAFFLSEDEAFGWSAGIYLLSAVLFGLAGVFFFWGRRPQAPPQLYMPPPGYGPRPP